MFRAVFYRTSDHHCCGPSEVFDEKVAVFMGRDRGADDSAAAGCAGRPCESGPQSHPHGDHAPTRRRSRAFCTPDTSPWATRHSMVHRQGHRWIPARSERSKHSVTGCGRSSRTFHWDRPPEVSLTALTSNPGSTHGTPRVLVRRLPNGRRPSVARNSASASTISTRASTPSAA